MSRTASGTEFRGTVQEFKDARGRKYYRARITLPDGVRQVLDIIDAHGLKV